MSGVSDLVFTDGGDKGSRTPDLLNAIETLYQLSYIPKKKLFVVYQNAAMEVKRTALAHASEAELVGPTRFELVTFCTPSKRATRLRYGPTATDTQFQNW